MYQSLIIAVCLHSITAIRGTEPPSVDRLIERRPRTSDNHVNTIKQTAKLLPDALKQFLHEHQIRIIAIRRLDEANFRHRPTVAKSWSEVRGTFVLIGGRHASIYLPEYYMWQGKEHPVTGVPGVFLHELGHAFDRLSGRLSSTPEFRRAYEADKKQLSSDEATNRRHYLTDELGREETFAEAFATVLRDRTSRDSSTSSTASSFADDFASSISHLSDGLLVE